MQIASDATKPKREQGKARKPRRLFIFLAFLSALLLFLASAGITALNVKNRLEQGQTNLRHVLDLAKTLPDATGNLDPKLDEVESNLKKALVEFKAAKQDLGPYGWMLEQMGWAPGLLYDASRLDAFLNMAIPGLEGGLDLIQVARPAWQAYSDSSATSTLAKLDKLLVRLQEPGIQAQLSQAENSFTGLATARQQIDSNRLATAKLKELLDSYDQFWPQAQSVFKAAHTLPALLPTALGNPTPQKYLIVAQNSDELRPTGGFISAVGLIEADGNTLKILDFKDSYQVGNRPYVTPPAALSRYMQAGTLTLRDANWWADFPFSARAIAGFYTQDTGVKVDGVVALDMQAVSYLFEALGPLELSKYGETFTAQNFQERIRYYYLQPGQSTTGDWWLKRKDFLGDLFRGLLGKIDNGGGISTSLHLAEALSKAMSEKHLLVNPFEPQLEAELLHYGLDGGLGSNWQGDYLMVVDANTGFNKINPLIKQEIAYQVEDKDSSGRRRATITLTYTNTAGKREGDPASGCKLEARYGTSYESMMAGCYWDYLRVYVPEHSELLDSSGFTSDSGRVDTFSEVGKTGFGGHFELEPGKSIVITLAYRLPEQVGQYQLLVQKQPGTAATPIKVEVINGPKWHGTLQTDWSSVPHQN